ncbi:tetratricopeptide repeat protein [Sulfolobus sp. E5-1-F]|uniref:tetratricopeptide repeat protein n=1 Tax=Saccharolobus sp. E5-1-F TaxID=2663019 RepID=UPI001296E780|nr:tetratricopeptide repeat protein [Sulfolobus sp. E5-1-F]QGA53189.1 tetratricopeptide repeat protein [Sulfolobus sp. E5-1-F]
MSEILELINKGKFDEALKRLKEEMEQKRDDPELYYLMGFVYFKTGKYKRAIDSLSKAVSLKKNEAKYHCLLGYSLYEEGYNIGDEKLIRKALKELQLSVEIDKDLPNKEKEYHYYMANILYELEDYEKALEEINETLKFYNSSEVHKLKGDILFQLKKYDKAIEEYKTNLNDDKNLYAIAYTYFTMGKYEQALEYYEKAISINPEEPYYYEGKAETLLFMGKLDEAYSTIKKALDIDPDNPHIKLTEVEILAEINSKEATKVLTEYLEEMYEFREVICEEIKVRKVKEKTRELLEKISLRFC